MYLIAKIIQYQDYYKSSKRNSIYWQNHCRLNFWRESDFTILEPEQDIWVSTRLELELQTSRRGGGGLMVGALTARLGVCLNRVSTTQRTPQSPHCLLCLMWFLTIDGTNVLYGYGYKWIFLYANRCDIIHIQYNSIVEYHNM